MFGLLGKLGKPSLKKVGKRVMNYFFTSDNENLLTSDNRKFTVQKP